MRSYVLVILSALGLAGLFFGYWMWQPASLKVGPGEVTQLPVPPPPKPGSVVFREGQLVWLKRYDKNGQLLSRFSSDQYVPQPDGTIHVTNPVAEFFLANHQHIEIHGDDGNVVAKDVPRITQNAFANTGPPAPPSRGRLNHVVLALVDDLKRTELLRMTTDNVVFDNETYRICTEGYKVPSHDPVAGDEVPVHVSGQIEMEGRGLTVRWNDKDGRLELLEIAHGNYLKIADPSGFSPGGSKRPAPTKTARSGAPLPEMLASTAKNGPGQVLEHFPGPATKRAGDSNASHVSSLPVIYQASFYDNVRINQPQADGKGDQILIEHVNRMDVDFVMKQSSPGSTTRPSPDTQPSTTQPSATTFPTTEAVTDNEPDMVAEVAAIAPASQPAVAKEPPIFVHWTGVLRITPLKTDSPPVPLAPGDSSVLLVGTPMTIHRIEPKQQGTEDIRCASVLYQTSGEKVWLGKSEQIPQIEVTKFPAASAREQAPTRLLSTGSVQYSRADAKAIMRGPGNAEVPLDPDERDKHPLLRAAWVKQAEFDFTQSQGDKQPFVRQGHLEGDVDVKHPRLALRSQVLDLLFDPPASAVATVATGTTDANAKSHEAQPNLRQIVATTGVFCQMDAGHSKQQNIECDRLALDTAKADGKLYARHVNATGSVHAYGDDDLKASYVDLLLNPSKKTDPANKGKGKSEDENPSVELDQMTARDNVVARSKEGSVATGDELHVVTKDGKQTTILTSRSGATVIDAKGNVVKGPEIQFESQDGQAHVIGAGSLHAVQQASATQPAQNVDVTWANEAIFDGGANHVDVDGSVLATSIDKRGYIDIARGEHIRIDLRPKPATQPADPSKVVAKDASKTAGAPGGLKMDPFKGKELSAMTISKDATLTSTLAAANGDILQQFELTGPTIIVNEFSPDGTPARSITVPAAGKMLSRDHRPVAKQATTDSDSSGARGATAFQWNKEMVYQEATHRADMVGDVLIVHQDDTADQVPVRMTCDHVIAWFEAVAKSASRPSSETKTGAESSSMQLRYLTAEGTQVVITRGVDQVIARQVEYEPKRHLLIATGTERNPVNFSNGGSGGGTAEEVDWDTTTWKMKSRNAIFDYRPPTPSVQSGTGKKKVPATNRSK
jgi:hypothetical protein